MYRAPLAFLAALAAATPALGDEVWTTPFGDIVYEADIGDVTVLSYPLADGSKGHAYFPGLGGNYTARGVHHGYWIEPREGTCGATMTGPDGLASTAWGRAVIAFDQPGFPTAFTALAGECFGEPAYSVRAEPVTAQ